MDKIYLSNKDILDEITINKDSYIVINDDVQSKQIKLNIVDCSVNIINKGNFKDRIINFINSNASIVEMVNSNEENTLIINNDNSNVEYDIIDLCDKDVRYEINERSIGQGSVNNINIGSICYKNKIKNFVVNTTNIDSNTVNNIDCFGIVKDESRLNYNVTSFIQKGAKKSIVKQSSNILLFDDKSYGKNSPILVIEENDVKASHGSSIGKIDDDTMFYLCSRGLSKAEAINLICLGKIEYLIKKIEDSSIRDLLIKDLKKG